MPESAVPDELFDADDHTPADRSDWIVQDGGLIHAPVVGDFASEVFASSPPGGRMKHLPRQGGRHQA